MDGATARRETDRVPVRTQEPPMRANPTRSLLQRDLLSAVATLGALVSAVGLIGGLFGVSSAAVVMGCSAALAMAGILSEEALEAEAT